MSTAHGTELKAMPQTPLPSGIPRNFFEGGVQQIQLRIESIENRDMGAVAP
jgi:hypothetical protein